MSDENRYFVLRSKDYKKGDRYSFHEYILHKDEYTNKVLLVPETSWERLKYAEVFESYEEAEECKHIVDEEDKILDIICLRKAEREY